MKKVFYIIILLIVIAILVTGGYLIWRFFLKPEQKEIQLLEGVGGIGAVAKLSEDTIFDYWINKNTDEVYYVAEDGKIYKISPSGEKQDTGSKATGNLSYIKPSSSGSLLLIAFDYPISPTFAIYNASNKTWQALPRGTVAAAWDPNSDNRLVYLKDNGTISRLYLFTLSDGRSREILKLTQKDLDLDWVSNNLIYFKERPSSEVASSLWAYNIENNSLKIVTEEFGLMTKWLDKGSAALKLSNGLLTIVNSENETLTLLDLVSLPSKCAATEKIVEIYCAAPDFSKISLSFIQRLPDSYLKKEVYFNDTIYLLPIETVGVTEVFNVKAPIADRTSEGNLIDADRLEIANGKLYFINRYDRKIYNIDI